MAVTAAMVTRSSGDVAETAAPAGPMPLVSCQAAVAAPGNPNERVTCGYPTSGTGFPVEEPAADLTDPRFFGAALPTALAADGAACMTGPKHPMLDPALPVLSASFNAAERG